MQASFKIAGQEQMFIRKAQTVTFFLFIINIVSIPMCFVDSKNDVHSLHVHEAVHEDLASRHVSVKAPH